MTVSGKENLFAIAGRHRNHLLSIAAVAIAVIAAITAMNRTINANMRESFLEAAEGNLVRRSLTLAEQADKAAASGESPLSP